MRLFEFKNWQLTVSEEAWGLSAFNKLLKRDKSKQKEVANAEMLFIYYYCDVKSDYMVMDEETRLKELKHDIQGLPDNWEYDDDMKKAVETYAKFETITERLYRQTYKGATAVGDYLENTAELLAERDVHGKPVTDIAKITTAMGRMPKLMTDLKSAYKEVVKEQEDTENKKKGAKNFNMFEDGFNKRN